MKMVLKARKEALAPSKWKSESKGVGLGMVVPICDPSYSGSRDGRLVVQGQLGQMLARLDLKNKLEPGQVAHDCNPRYLEGGHRED
jgi:hypothetical protein